MQTIRSLQHPESLEHLSPIAAKMILAALPEHIQQALLAHVSETQYPLELVLEMAIAGFLDSEAITFTDCKSEYAR
jgi:hypothetical protein